MKRLLLCLGCGASLLAPCGFAAEPAPALWGYGVQTCERFLKAAEGYEQGDEAAVVEYRRYEEWLAGFVSGMNLATGRDILRGAEIGAVMGRIAADCRGRPARDFFNATMDFVRLMMQLDKHP